jgi:hypothetical protein
MWPENKEQKYRKQMEAAKWKAHVREEMEATNCPLDASQKQAVLLTFEQPFIAIIDPPRTGKTSVCIKIFRHWLKRSIEEISQNPDGPWTYIALCAPTTVLWMFFLEEQWRLLLRKRSGFSEYPPNVGMLFFNLRRKTQISSSTLILCNSR